MPQTFISYKLIEWVIKLKAFLGTADIGIQQSDDNIHKTMARIMKLGKHNCDISLQIWTTNDKNEVNLTICVSQSQDNEIRSNKII